MATTLAPVSTTATIPLELPDIQGNILAGFNKDHQKFLFLHVDDVARAKVWLQGLIPMVADCQTVKAANDQRKQDVAEGKTPANAAWLNVAFNYPGFEKLAAPGLSHFPPEFKDGMASRSMHLGDVGANAPDQWDRGCGSAGFCM